jgi:hypothetical protein
VLSAALFRNYLSVPKIQVTPVILGRNLGYYQARFAPSDLVLGKLKRNMPTRFVVNLGPYLNGCG